MTDCRFRASTGINLSGTFAPAQGVTTEDIRNTIVPQRASAQSSLTFGTTSGKADILICQDRTLIAVMAATYDLYTGTDLKDINGLTAALRKVKYLGVVILSGGDTAGVAIGNAANPWPGFFGASNDIAKIFPDGPSYQGGSPAGVALTVTTNINLKIENLGAVPVTFRVIIAGTSV